MQRDGFTCRLCKNSEEQLHVHHRYYVSGRVPWDYPDGCFFTLCATCHEAQRIKCSNRRYWELGLNGGLFDSHIDAVVLEEFCKQFRETRSFGLTPDEIFKELTIALGRMNINVKPTETKEPV